MSENPAQTGIPRPARGIPRPTSGIPRPTAQTGGRPPTVKIAFGRRIENKTKTRAAADEENAEDTNDQLPVAMPKPVAMSIKKPAAAVTLTVTKNKPAKRLRSASRSASKDDSPALSHRAKRQMEESSATVVKKPPGAKLRSKMPVNGICTTKFNPKATLNFAEVGSFTGKKSVPKQTEMEKENAALKEQLKNTKEELKDAKEELDVAKASNASKQAEAEAVKLELEGKNRELEKCLEKCEKKLISLDIDPVSLETWWKLQEARKEQRKKTTARARAMRDKLKKDNEESEETHTKLLALRDKLKKMHQEMMNPDKNGSGPQD